MTMTYFLVSQLIVCLLILAYVYQGYLWVLKVFPKRKSIEYKTIQTFFPEVTILITVFNEERFIKKKIENTLSLKYPPDLLEILVASDGSTDETDHIVLSCVEPNVKLFRPESSSGKTDTQNQAFPKCKGSIIVFTDAETLFEPNFLEELIQAFTDERVGGVTGHLLFKQKANSMLAQSQGFYWDYELKLREEESRKGFLAVASGACMAIRKELFVPMPQTYGEDCVVPLSIITQGFEMRYVSTALAFDEMPSDQKGELNNRRRMTMRGWQGTWAYSRLLNPFKSGRVAFALWSHKILRWLSPVFVLLATVSSFFLVFSSRWFLVLAIGFVFFYVFGFMGWLQREFRFRVPLAQFAYSFLIANLGFALGLISVLRGTQVTRYKTNSKKST